MYLERGRTSLRKHPPPSLSVVHTTYEFSRGAGFCFLEINGGGLVVSHEIAPLKRFLLIFSDLIFDSRVVRGIPSLAAAPAGPYTRPPHSRKAASMADFS